jgi:hypothetical protein
MNRFFGCGEILLTEFGSLFVSEENQIKLQLRIGG